MFLIIYSNSATAVVNLDTFLVTALKEVAAAAVAEVIENATPAEAWVTFRGIARVPIGAVTVMTKQTTDSLVPRESDLSPLCWMWISFFLTFVVLNFHHNWNIPSTRWQKLYILVICIVSKIASQIKELDHD